VVTARLCNGLAIHGKDASGAAAGVYAVQTLLDQVKDAMRAIAMKREFIDRRIEDEQDRLTAVAQERANSSTSSNAARDVGVLIETIKQNEEARVESVAAEEAMKGFYYSLRGSLGSSAAAPSCSLLRCSEHAECIESDGQATCRCRQCFEGNGFHCRATACSIGLYEQPLLVLTAAALAQSEAQYAADIFLAVYSKDRLALVFRDPSLSDVGFVMVGEAGEEVVQWSPPQAFSNATALQPTIVILPTGRLVISYRDVYSAGIGYLVGGQVALEGNLSNTSVNLTLPQAYVRDQSYPAPLVPLANSEVVCLYAEPEISVSGIVKHAYGAAALLKVTAAGDLYLMGKYRFAEAKVSHIKAVSITPTSFVIAFSGIATGQQVASSGELSAVWMESIDNELVRHPKALALEPGKTGMQTRDVALVSQNLLAYSYQSSSNAKTKVAVIRLIPTTHEMSVQGQTKVISSGAAYDIQSISLPYGGDVPAPYSLTYFTRVRDGAVAEVCKVDFLSGLDACHQFQWAPGYPTSGSAGRLGDGRLVFAYTDNMSTPFLQFLAAPSSIE